jgi:hypothetical protein
MKNFRSLFLFTVLVSFVGISAYCNAVTTMVFQDNFDYASAAAFPNPAVDADPAALVGSWMDLTEQDSLGQINHGIQVTNNAVPGPAQGQKYLGVQRVAGGFAFAVGGFTAQATSTLTLEFDFRLVGDANHPSYPYNMLSIYMKSGSTFTGWGNEAIAVDFRNNGWIRRYLDNQNSGDWLNGEFARDQWVHVKFDIDLATQKYAITVGNNPIESGFDFNYTSSSIGYVMFYAGTGGTTFYIDNVVATADLNITPPPSVEVFKDNFENVTPVAFPDSNTFAIPVAQIGAWSSLTQQDGSGTIKHGIQVTDNAIPGPIGDSDNYLAIQRIVYASAVGTFATPAGPDRTTVEFDLYLVGNSTHPSYPWNAVGLYMKSGGTYGGWGNEVILVDFWNNGWVRKAWNNGANADWLNGEFARNQWVHVKFDIDFATQTYAMTVGSNPTESGLAFNYPSSDIGCMMFYADASNMTFYLDNVVVKRTDGTCEAIVRGDFNEDCKVNMDDLSVFAGDWLKCNLQPASLCAN